MTHLSEIQMHEIIDKHQVSNFWIFKTLRRYAAAGIENKPHKTQAIFL